MAGVVGRFRSAAGVPMVGYVSLSPSGEPSKLSGESVGGTLRVPLGGDGSCRKTGLVASAGTQWRVKPYVTVDGHGVEYTPWTIQLVHGKVIDLFTGTVVEDEPASTPGPVPHPGPGLSGELVAPGVLEIELDASQIEGI